MLPHSRYPLVVALRRFSSAPPLGNAAFFPPLPEQQVDPAPPGSPQRSSGGDKAGGAGAWAAVGALGAAAWFLSVKEPRSSASASPERLIHAPPSMMKNRQDSILPSSALVDGPHRKS